MSEHLISMGPAMANHLWQSTAFAALVWGLALLLRRNQARLRYGLWLVASAKFLVPFALLISLGTMLPRPQHAVVTMPVYSAVDEVGLPFSEVMPVAEIPTHAAIEPRHEWGTQMSWPVVLEVVWLCGVVVVVGVWSGRWLRVMRMARAAVRVQSGREADLLRQVAARIGGQRVGLALSGESMEPGVFGVFRPLLIWPLRLSERLDDAHIEAIVAHELMHVRRRDNLTAVLHMLVQAAFWFHPAVWWMGARLVEERERACDEAVVEMGSRPGVYAESLLKAVRFCVESPLVCVSGVTGADLKQRVRSIMTLRMRRLGIAGKVALAVLAVGAIAGPVAFGVVRMIPLYGQVLKATGPLPSYAFVVIKPSQDTAHGADMAGEQTHYLVTAKMLIQFAYGVFSPPKMINLDVEGGPDWIDSEVFDIVGKVSPEDFALRQKMNRGQGHEQRQLMEQSLLADRFKLKVHTEMRDQPVYALTVGKNLKLARAKDATGSARVNPYPGSMTPDQLKRGLIVQARGRNFVMTVKGMTLDTLVDALMAQKEVNNKPVVNQTGLTEAYDFTLTWGPPDSAGPESGDEALEPPLFTAIQQQLGLKLTAGKAPAEAVVIDHIEKPVFDSAVGAAVKGFEDAAAAEYRNMLEQPVSAVPENTKARLVPIAQVQEKAVSEVGAPAAAAAAQADAAALPAIKFDVVTFKPCPATAQTMKVTILPAEGDSIGWQCQSIGRMLLFAYTAKQPFHLIGEPAWVDADPYTFQAKVAPDDVAVWRALSLAARRAMVRDVMVEALKLKEHPDTTEHPVYALVVARGGPKLTPRDESGTTCVVADRDASCPPKMVPYKDNEETKLGRSTFKARDITWVGPDTAYNQGTTMAGMAEVLAARLDRPVIDKTGLPGLYDVTFTLPFPHYDPKRSSVDDTNFAGIFDGMKALGLRLEPDKAPLNGIVVDHIERPPEN